MYWLPTILLTVTAPVVAPGYDVQRPDGSPITFATLSDQYVKQRRGELGRFPVRVVSDGFCPLRQPGHNQPPSGAPPLPFLTEVLLIGSSKEDYYQKDRADENYVLIGMPAGEGKDPVLHGWVPACRVLTRNTCMEDHQSGIRIKGMPINSLDYLKPQPGAAPDPTRLRPPQIRLAPTDDGTPAGTFRFFDFYHVLADTHPGAENDARGYALLGDLPEWSTNKTKAPAVFQADAKIIGWVEKSRLCMWRTREALQWDDLRWPDKNGQPRTRTERGVAYRTREHALQAAGFATPPPTVNGPAIEEEFENGRPVVWEPRRMRFPLLTMRIGEDEVTHQTFEKKVLYRVGVIGDVYDASGTPVIKAPNRQAINENIRQIEEELKRTEMLFVIDRTVSMREWWPNISRVVGKLKDKVKADGRKVAIGFCYYGDVYPGTEREGKATLTEAVTLKGVQPGRLIELTTEGAAFDQQLLELADKARMIEGGYRPEMVYAGLEIGLREAKWGGTQGGRFARKVVILIGDDGNHKLPPNEEQDTQERIANLCVYGRSEPPPEKSKDKLFESPKEFYALQMNPVSSDPADPSFHFQAQAHALVKRIKGKSALARAEYFHIADEKALYATIDARYAELIKDSTAKQLELQGARTGATTRIQDPEVAAMLRSVAAKADRKIEYVLEGIQAFDVRYIWSHGPKTDEPLVRKMILANKGEIEAVVAKLKELFRDHAKPPTPEEVAFNLIAIQAGDELTMDEIRKLAAKEKDTKLQKLKKSHGFSFMGPFMTYIRNQSIPDQPRQATDDIITMEIKQRLEKRLYLFEDILAERVSKYDFRKDTLDAVRLDKVGDPKALVGDQRRGFSRGERQSTSGSSSSNGKGKEEGRFVWYWLDFAEEWP